MSDPKSGTWAMAEAPVAGSTLPYMRMRRNSKHTFLFRISRMITSDGRYLGEVRGDDRLITRTANPPRPRGAFTPLPARPARARYRGFSSFAVMTGFADFPAPENL